MARTAPYLTVISFGFLLVACDVNVATRNAPVGQGNINSTTAQLGSMYRYDSGAPSIGILYRSDPTDGNLQVRTGSFYNENVSKEVAIDVNGKLTAGDWVDVGGKVRGEVGRSLEFSMKNYTQRSVKNPNALVNSEAGIEALRASGAVERDGPNIRYIYIETSYSGSDFEIGFRRDDEVSTDLTLPTPGASVPSVKVKLDGAKSIKCGGGSTACVITAAVYRMVTSGGNVRLVRDESLEKPYQIQQMVAGEAVPAEPIVVGFRD